jgi:hypothetical protein
MSSAKAQAVPTTYVGVDVKTEGKTRCLGGQDSGCCRTSRYAATLDYYSMPGRAHLSATASCFAGG